MNVHAPLATISARPAPRRGVEMRLRLREADIYVEHGVQQHTVWRPLTALTASEPHQWTWVHTLQTCRVTIRTFEGPLREVSVTFSNGTPRRTLERAAHAALLNELRHEAGPWYRRHPRALGEYARALFAFATNRAGRLAALDKMRHAARKAPDDAVLSLMLRVHEGHIGD